MRLIKDNVTLADFEAWSGAIETKETILNNDQGEAFDNMIEELHPDGITDTQLNDLLWFEPVWIYQTLGISIDEEE